MSSAAVLGSLQDVPLLGSLIILLDTGSSWVVQGSERRRRLHLPSACPPGPCRTQELESFTRSHGSDFLLVIRLSVCTSSSSSLPHGSLLLLLLHLSFSFHFLSIRLLRRFIAMMTAAEQHLQNSLFKSEHLTCYSTNASHKQMLCCRSKSSTTRRN